MTHTRNGEPRHLCGIPAWPMCTVCDGRMHQSGCTSKRKPAKDCCPQRHVEMFRQGILEGQFDGSIGMLHCITLANLIRLGVDPSELKPEHFKCGSDPGTIPTI